MANNEANIQAGAEQMAKQLDGAKTPQQAEQVADRLRADYVDCMDGTNEGAERWSSIVNKMSQSEKKGTGWDVQFNNSKDSCLPSITLVDSSQGLQVGSTRYFAPSLVINEDHSERKGFTPHAESGATPRQVRPIEMR